MTDDRPLMRCTPGITQKRLAVEPLATEAEATPGPDDENPFEVEATEREQQWFKEQETALRLGPGISAKGGLSPVEWNDADDQPEQSHPPEPAALPIFGVFEEVGPWDDR
jgi:hypothetical protein